MKYMNKIFHKIYMIMTLNILFMISSAISLFTFTLYPSLVTGYQLVRKDRMETNKFKIRMLTDYISLFKENIRNYYKEGIMFFVVSLVIFINIYFLSKRNDAISNFMYYISIFASIFVFVSMNLSAYLVANEKLTRFENYKNSLLITLAFALDIMLALCLMVGAMLIAEAISLMLIFLIIFASSIYIFDFVFTNILEKKSLSHIVFGKRHRQL